MPICKLIHIDRVSPAFQISYPLKKLSLFGKLIDALLIFE